MRTTIPQRRAQRGPLPKFWKPKLDSVTKITVQAIHWDLLTRFTAGRANSEDLWDWIETGYTYSLMVTLFQEDGLQLTDEAINAIAAQLNIYDAVIARFRHTGRVGFAGPELQIARTAAEVMDGLIELDRHGIAEKAARQCTELMERIRSHAATGQLAPKEATA